MNRGGTVSTEVLAGTFVTIIPSEVIRTICVMMRQIRVINNTMLCTDVPPGAAW